MDTMLERYAENPILGPVKEHPWESVRVFNSQTCQNDQKLSRQIHFPDRFLEPILKRLVGRL